MKRVAEREDEALGGSALSRLLRSESTSAEMAAVVAVAGMRVVVLSTEEASGVRAVLHAEAGVRSAVEDLVARSWSAHARAACSDSMTDDNRHNSHSNDYANTCL